MNPLGYHTWLEKKDDQFFKNDKVFIKLTIYNKSQHIPTSPISWVGWSEKHLKVAAYRREKEYCGELPLLIEEDFGKLCDKSLDKAKEYFNNLVKEYI
tara:strand:+ start:1202 stop:1495 length:294 start_codon:yes stop_codon:yes gene_type:complete